MKVLGIIAEYNPFHNGHLYQLDKVVKMTDSRYCVVVMSGNFVQRGEPALMNKWARTEAALYGGADLVLELPLPYALSSAEMFAHGAVKILDNINVVNYMGFGSEAGEISPLYNVAKILADEPDKYKKILKDHLDKGLSFPDARQQALKEFSPIADTDILKSSNNILAIEYLKALLRLGSHIEPFTIKRLGNDYLENELTGTLSSATSIRKALYEGSYEKISQSVPKTGFDIIMREAASKRCPVSIEGFEDILFSKLRKMTTLDISSFMYVGEGLENRIFNALKTSGDLDSLIKNICTRRYTKTRIKRILSHILLDIKKKDLIDADFENGPLYSRVLGFNDKGRELLGIMRKTSLIPVIIKPAHIKKLHNPSIEKMFKMESYSTDIYTLAYKNPADRLPYQDYTKNLIIK